RTGAACGRRSPPSGRRGSAPSPARRSIGSFSFGVPHRSASRAFVRGLAPQRAETRDSARDALDRLAVAYAPGEPIRRRLDEDRPADREAFDDAAVSRDFEGLRKIVLGRFEPEEDDAATERICFLHRALDRFPSGARRLALEFPPV